MKVSSAARQAKSSFTDWVKDFLDKKHCLLLMAARQISRTYSYWNYFCAFLPQIARILFGFTLSS